MDGYMDEWSAYACDLYYSHLIKSLNSQIMCFIVFLKKHLFVLVSNADCNPQGRELKAQS